MSLVPTGADAEPAPPEPPIRRLAALDADLERMIANGHVTPASAKRFRDEIAARVTAGADSPAADGPAISPGPGMTGPRRHPAQQRAGSPANDGADRHVHRPAS